MSRLSRRILSKLAAPAVAAVVGVQAVADGLIGGALHVDVERGVDAQAALVHRFRAVGGFQILANLLDEIRGQVLRGDCRCRPSGVFLAASSSAGVIFPSSAMRSSTRLRRARARARMQDRRIARPANHSGEQRGFLQRQLADGFAEIKLRGGFKAVIAVGQINLIAVHRENLLLGVVALDLKRQQRFLNLCGACCGRSGPETECRRAAW